MTPAREFAPSQRIALVLWNGDIGGAEIHSLRLAQEFQALGAHATIVFVERPEPLSDRLTLADVPFTRLNFRRGREVLRHPRRYAEAVADVGPDGALLLECGFMGAGLRAGGSNEPIVAVEHGPVNARPGYSLLRRVFGRVDRMLGARADDVEVGVSDYLVGQMRQHPHSKSLVRIYNGVDGDRFAPDPDRRTAETDIAIGCMSRLVAGKGLDHLIRAVAETRTQAPVTLRIAGAGPEQAALEALATSLGLGSVVTFAGVVDDLNAFWNSCDIAAVPTAELEEGFSLVTLEAMACGKAIVAARSGAVPELVLDGETGTLVSPGDSTAMASAIEAYARDPILRREHGAAARKRAIESFHLRKCASEYLELFTGLRSRSSGAAPAGAGPTPARGSARN
jgi:glycosyltransferase involved in cell wall biosynthesis